MLVTFSGNTNNTNHDSGGSASNQNLDTLLVNRMLERHSQKLAWLETWFDTLKITLHQLVNAIRFDRQGQSDNVGFSTDLTNQSTSVSNHNIIMRGCVIISVFFPPIDTPAASQGVHLCICEKNRFQVSRFQERVAMTD